MDDNAAAVAFAHLDPEVDAEPLERMVDVLNRLQDSDMQDIDMGSEQ